MGARNLPTEGAGTYDRGLGLKNALFVHYFARCPPTANDNFF